jgi:uroporphyrinogen III methyltransferase/synthase
LSDAPLRGKLIVVTRPRHQAGSLTAKLRELGAEVVEAPAIQIEPPEDWQPVDAALGRLDDYDWVVFTSVNAVEAFFGRLRAPLPARLHVAAIGPATADALVGRGVTPEVVPERFVAEDVYRAVSARADLGGKKFLLPRADIARQALPRLLREAGAEVDVVVVYRTVPARAEIARAAALVAEGKVDIVTFTSGSTVRSFFHEIDPKDLGGRPIAASIGPITSDALRELGVTPSIEALSFTTDGLVDAIVRHFIEN